MDFPVISPSGHTYDQESIAAWLSRRPVDPLTLAPLSAASLYPNRAVQSEILEQLERLADAAATRADADLAEAVREKLSCVRHAKAKVSAGQPLRKLDRYVAACARWVTWCGVLAWEQTLVFVTSFGALLCIAVDAVESLKLKKLQELAAKGLAAEPPKRAPTLFSDFLRLAIWPTLPVPQHWHVLGRVHVYSLRVVLLLPVGHFFGVVALGGLLSLLRFGQRCVEVRAVERERAARSQWFDMTMNFFSAVAGLSSFGLFLRLYSDHRIRVWFTARAITAAS